MVFSPGQNGESGEASKSRLDSGALQVVPAASHGGHQAHCRQQAEKIQMIDVCYVSLGVIPHEGISFPILNVPLYFENRNAGRELH